MIEWPEIGSRESAVRSCVSLLSAVCGQPEDFMERWLDLYYQVRRAKEKADAAARAAERLKEMAQLEEAFQAAMSISAEDRGALRQEASEDGGRIISAPTEKTEAASEAEEPAPLREKDLPKEDPSQAAAPEKPVKRPGGKDTPRPSSIGNTRGHDAAVFKRQVRDRLEAVRQKGVSAPELVRAATTAGAFTANNIYEILEGKVLKIEIYRALDEALWHFEN